MGRRWGRNPADRFKDGSRSTIGDHYVEQATAEIRRAFLRECAIFLPVLTAEEVIPMLFHDDDVSMLRKMHGKVATHSDKCEVEMNKFGFECNVNIFFESVAMETPHEDIAHFNADRGDQLASAIRMATDLHNKWYAVTHLLRWFDKNATAGAIRANWPCVMKLCPDSPGLKSQEGPAQRYRNPPELASLLPLIRDTAGTVAQMAMLPDNVPPRTKGSLALTLDQRTGTREGVSFITDNPTIFL